MKDFTEVFSEELPELPSGFRWSITQRFFDIDEVSVKIKKGAKTVIKDRADLADDDTSYVISKAIELKNRLKI